MNPNTGHRGPHPGIVAIVLTTLFATSLALFFALSHGATYPRPWDPAELFQGTYRQFPWAFRWSAFFQFGVSVPLGILTAALTSRLSFLGVNVTGVSIARYGGTAAALGAALSALANWTLSQPGIASDLQVMHALELFSFGTGGILYTSALGLFMAGISVPCLFGGYAPRWVAWLGIILAAIAEVSTLTLVEPALAALLPIVRFPAYVWMIAMGFTLAKRPAA